MWKFLLAALVLVACAATSYGNKYLGCFKDVKSRVLSGKFTKGSMTVAKCIQTCSIENDLYAGVENGNQCFCGSILKIQEKLPNSACSKKCSANSKQKCGGWWKISVYATNKYVGCYQDKRLRLLAGPKTKSKSQMTAKYCIKYCKGKGTVFAATESSDQCFCGDFMKNYPKKSDSECSHKCTGDSSENCGGHWRGSVYRV